MGGGVEASGLFVLGGVVAAAVAALAVERDGGGAGEGGCGSFQVFLPRLSERSSHPWRWRFQRKRKRMGEARKRRATESKAEVNGGARKSFARFRFWLSFLRRQNVALRIFYPPLRPRDRPALWRTLSLGGDRGGDRASVEAKNDERPVPENRLGGAKGKDGEGAWRLRSLFLSLSRLVKSNAPSLW